MIYYNNNYYSYTLAIGDAPREIKKKHALVDAVLSYNFYNIKITLVTY